MSAELPKNPVGEPVDESDTGEVTETTEQTVAPQTQPLSGIARLERLIALEHAASVKFRTLNRGERVAYLAANPFSMFREKASIGDSVRNFNRGMKNEFPYKGDINKPPRSYKAGKLAYKIGDKINDAADKIGNKINDAADKIAKKFKEKSDLQQGAEFHAQMAAMHRQAARKDTQKAMLHRRASGLHHLAAGHHELAAVHQAAGHKTNHDAKAKHFSQIARQASAKLGIGRSEESAADVNPGRMYWKRKTSGVPDAAGPIKPLHLQQEGNPYPHVPSTHAALRDYHENKAADYVRRGLHGDAAIHRKAAQLHGKAHYLLSKHGNRTEAYKASHNAHNFARKINY
jgi:hypothetical protein